MRAHSVLCHSTKLGVESSKEKEFKKLHDADR